MTDRVAKTVVDAALRGAREYARGAGQRLQKEELLTAMQPLIYRAYVDAIGGYRIMLAEGGSRRARRVLNDTLRRFGAETARGLLERPTTTSEGTAP